MSDDTTTRTYGPEGVTPSARAARGIILYLGLDEAKASADGTNLVEIAEKLQRYARQLASRADTQAVVALAPEGPNRDLDAVRAVAAGSPAATGQTASAHGPVRSRVPSRVHAPGTRQQPATATPNRGSIPEAGLLIDAPRREVHIDGALSSLTYKEFDLLAFLVSREDRTVSRSELIAELWSNGPAEEVPTERTVDVHIRRLRTKLGRYSSIVRTIRGGGYRYDDHPDVVVWQAIARPV
ncbi:winged helix-turn-helix domain-containing protein [Saxibacter everestensis]|uniref:Winged helix-turn-helix domain-containing protein n=1 Tax=Saxibacter everestensis TaxID=2909229 RepID=A0ABY8QQ75_9MICO|nr:winged helix-turn-helix domain-containing protein [Brevibacteriaceae bacterium ZFBP1038]